MLNFLIKLWLALKTLIQPSWVPFSLRVLCLISHLQVESTNARMRVRACDPILALAKPKSVLAILMQFITPDPAQSASCCYEGAS